MEYRSAMVYNDDKIDHLPDIISKLLYHIIKEVNKFLDLHDEADYSGPTVRKSSNNLTIAYNIYPTKNKIDFFFKNLNEILSDSLNNYSKLGELIVYESNKGEIFDMGKKAFNIVKAAESGEEGDPEQYRDYIIPKRVNRFAHVSRKVDEISYYDGNLSIIDSNVNLPLVLKVKDVQIDISGGNGTHTIHLVNHNTNGMTIDFKGDGFAKVQTTIPVKFEGAKIIDRDIENNIYNLQLVSDGQT